MSNPWKCRLVELSAWGTLWFPGQPFELYGGSEFFTVIRSRCPGLVLIVGPGTVPLNARSFTGLPPSSFRIQPHSSVSDCVSRCLLAAHACRRCQLAASTTPAAANSSRLDMVLMRIRSEKSVNNRRFSPGCQAARSLCQRSTDTTFLLAPVCFWVTLARIRADAQIARTDQTTPRPVTVQNRSGALTLFFSLFHHEQHSQRRLVLSQRPVGHHQGSRARPAADRLPALAGRGARRPEEAVRPGRLRRLHRDPLAVEREDTRRPSTARSTPACGRCARWAGSSSRRSRARARCASPIRRTCCTTLTASRFARADRRAGVARARERRRSRGRRSARRCTAAVDAARAPRKRAPAVVKAVATSPSIRRSTRTRA